jgi:hypothetical protein
LNFLGKVRRAALREQVAASQRATTTAPEEHR